MKQIVFFLVGAWLLTTACVRQYNVNIVPEPVQVKVLKGSLAIDENTALHFQPQQEEENKATAQYIREYLSEHLGLHVACEKSASQSKNAIYFDLTATYDTTLHEEGYSLTVDKNAVHISANTTQGWIYALQTLHQLSFSNRGKINIPTVEITDYPRFEWRGSMLDVSRHFFDIDYIKKHLDIMAFYKLNKFHWHLTDDHGWRIQIDKYPKLTEIGAWRVDRSNVSWREGEAPKPGEPATYGGFYTKDQIREVVEYAALRNIEVIPEIEIPGHCSEILAAYPEFACDNYPYYVQIGPYWPPKAILCGGNNHVMQFLKDVVDEVAELFPSKYIHIGGDEAIKDNWKTCPKCQQRIKQQHLKNDEELQSWMIRTIEQHILAKGKQIIGWDEILEGGVTSTATVMYWRGWVGDKIIVDAVRHGNNVIMAPNSYCYLDYYQAPPETETQESFGGSYLPIEKVYAFDPVPAALTPEEAVFIKGGQANLWAEFLYTPRHVQYMLLPRLLALSEAVWSPKENKSWEHFVQKLPGQKARLGALGYTYSDKVGLIEDEPTKKE
ncbi:MAG: beta-N-acetylhexosaminidase [Dysgonamonadaceae bacterium]|nr:beta-N-acetylhexosaminidase [Dysgonamonadaceae bacterium]